MTSMIAGRPQASATAMVGARSAARSTFWTTMLVASSAAAAKVPAERNCVGQADLQNLPPSQ